MDPDANLKEQLALARQIIHIGERHVAECGEGYAAKLLIEQQAHCGEKLAELVLALDEWVRKGGFLPGRWHKPVRFDPGYFLEGE